MTARGGPTAGPPPGATPLTVKQAAPILGIDERSVRKRVAAGTLYAEPGGTGRLLVWIPDATIAASRRRAPRPEDGPGPAGPGFGSGQEAAPVGDTAAAVVGAVRDELAAVREEWLTAVLAHVGRLERHNADLTRRLAVRDRLVAQLRERVEQLECAGATRRDDDAPVPATGPAGASPAVAHRRRPWLPRRTLGDRLFNPLVERALWPETRFDRFLRWVCRGDLP